MAAIRDINSPPPPHTSIVTGAHSDTSSPFYILHINILYFFIWLIEFFIKVQNKGEKESSTSKYFLFVEYIVQNIVRNKPFHVVIYCNHLFIALTENVLYHDMYHYRDIK